MAQEHVHILSGHILGSTRRLFYGRWLGMPDHAEVKGATFPSRLSTRCECLPAAQRCTALIRRCYAVKLMEDIVGPLYALTL